VYGFVWLGLYGYVCVWLCVCMCMGMCVCVYGCGVCICVYNCYLCTSIYSFPPPPHISYLIPIALSSAMDVFQVRTWIQYQSQQTGQFVLFFDLSTFFSTFSSSVDISVS